MLEAKKQLSEFKKFILRGNVVDLAVAVVIGGAFNTVVQALVKDFITPLILAFTGGNSKVAGTFVFNGQTFDYGDFINVVISFIVISAVIFFFVVQPINKLSELTTRKKNTDDPSTKKCPECLSEIPADARRCKFCTAVLTTSKDAAGDDKPASLKPLKASKK